MLAVFDKSPERLQKARQVLCQVPQIPEIEKDFCPRCGELVEGEYLPDETPVYEAGDIYFLQRNSFSPFDHFCIDRRRNGNTLWNK